MPPSPRLTPRQRRAGGNLIPAFIPTRPPADIEITAENVALANGTVIQADTTGGADAGSITFNVGTLKTQAGPDGRVLISSTSNWAKDARAAKPATLPFKAYQV